MNAITICRTNIPVPTDADLDVVRRFLMACYVGVGETEKKAWNRFWKRMFRMDAGEIAQLELIVPRNPRFHRKFFALLNLGFEAWEPARKRKTYKGISMQKNFDQFRDDVTILAGYYVQTFDLSGRMILKSKSIAFGNMDEAEFAQLYSAVADVLLGKVLTTYKGRAELDDIIDRIVGFL
jgi:hypothetical protein